MTIKSEAVTQLLGSIHLCRVQGNTV